MKGIGRDMDREILQLSEQLLHLTGRVDRLSARLAALEKNEIAIIERQEAVKPASSRPVSGEGVLDAVGSSTLLPRIAALCFTLVFALILRTVTDNGYLDLNTGSLVGLLYAAALIFWGWKKLRDGSQTAIVFPAAGAFLLYAIVLEAHSHFASITVTGAFSVLFAAAIGLGLLGIAYRKPVLLHVGILGAALVALAIDFPRVHLAPASFLLLTGNVIALIAHRRQVAGTLKWFTLFLTLCLWLLWSFKLSATLGKNVIPAEELALQWFFPSLFLHSLTYFASLTIRVIGSDEPLGFFHGTIPTITVLFTYLSAAPVVRALQGNAAALGYAASAGAALLIAAAAILASHRKSGAPGCNAISFAAVLLLCLGLPESTGLLQALPVLSFTAFLLALLSGNWQSGGVRLTSYLLQGMVCLSVLLTLPQQLASPVTSGAAAFALALLASIQYRWCRKNRASASDSAYFAWIDRNDIGAIVLLLSGLVGFFGVARLLLHAGIIAGLAGGTDAFACGQSILINSGAVVLLLLSDRYRNRELLAVAGAVVLLGAIKVFIFDLFTAKGLPLVISVFSFGIVAMVCSVVCRRWPNRRQAAAESENAAALARADNSAA